MDIDQKRRLRNILQPVSAIMGSKKYAFFDERSRSEFLSRYNESNILVAKEYLKCDSTQLFSNDKENYNIFKGLTLEKSVQTLTLALVSKHVSGNDLVTLRIIRKIEETIRNKKFLKNIFKSLISKLNIN